MARADLLALTADDLAALTNRGTVKRARASRGGGRRGREADDGTVIGLRRRRDGGAAGRRAAGGRAAAPAPRSGLPPHRARVLAYAETARCRPAAESRWTRGDVDRRSASPALRPAALRRGHTGRPWRDGDIVRSAKPIALLHDVEATVRFLVPRDLAYARCDCADPPPCEHVVPAVHAFRALDRRAQESGLIELAPAAASPSPRCLLTARPLAERRRRRTRPARRGRRRGQRRRRQRPAARRGALPDRRARVGRGHLRRAGRPRRAPRAPRCGVRPAAGRPGRRRGALAHRCAAGGQRAGAVRGGPRRRPGPRSAAGGWSGSARASACRGTVDVDALVYDTVAHRVLALGRTFGDPTTLRPGRSPTSPRGGCSGRPRSPTSAPATHRHRRQAAAPVGG